MRAISTVTKPSRHRLSVGSFQQAGSVRQSANARMRGCWAVGTRLGCWATAVRDRPTTAHHGRRPDFPKPWMGANRPWRRRLPKSCPIPRPFDLTKTASPPIPSALVRLSLCDRSHRTRCIPIDASSDATWPIILLDFDCVHAPVMISRFYSPQMWTKIKVCVNIGIPSSQNDHESRMTQPTRRKNMNRQ